MKHPLSLAVGLVLGFGLALLSLQVYSRQDGKKRPAAPPDVVAEAQKGGKAQGDRAEQKPNRHDESDVFDPKNAPPSSTALAKQPEKGEIQGFDFRRDPLDSKKPMMTFDEIMRADVAAKPKVMALQKKLLEGRYDLEPRFHATARMSRGKKVNVAYNAETLEKLDNAEAGED